MFDFNANKPHSFVLFCITPAITESGRSLGSGGPGGEGGGRNTPTSLDLPPLTLISYLAIGLASLFHTPYLLQTLNSPLSQKSEGTLHTFHEHHSV